jgi:hypothetical protein
VNLMEIAIPCFVFSVSLGFLVVCVAIAVSIWRGL